VTLLSFISYRLLTNQNLRLKEFLERCFFDEERFFDERGFCLEPPVTRPAAL
jgi:hypothetical protein